MPQHQGGAVGAPELGRRPTPPQIVSLWRMRHAHHASKFDTPNARLITQLARCFLTVDTCATIDVKLQGIIAQCARHQAQHDWGAILASHTHPRTRALTAYVTRDKHLRCGIARDTRLRRRVTPTAAAYCRTRQAVAVLGRSRLYCALSHATSSCDAVLHIPLPRVKRNCDAGLHIPLLRATSNLDGSNVGVLIQHVHLRGCSRVWSHATAWAETSRFAMSSHGYCYGSA